MALQRRKGTTGAGARFAERRRRWWALFHRPPLPCWYHPDYRLPLPSIQARTGAEPRRADLVAWYLEQGHVVPASALQIPELIAWADLARVHTEPWLASLGEPTTLASIFGVTADEARVDELMRTARLACGGTLAAAREALARSGPTLNLLGGFHHAAPDHGGGFCPVNDIAVAVAVLRAEGFRGRVTIIDLDAHPPDGTAACLSGRHVWIGSLSGSRWTPLPGVDETVIEGADDATYLAALEGLLARAPGAELTFVIAGGDVLAGDPLGRLNLTLVGAGERDRRVLATLAGKPSVWLPGGGYHGDAWKILARTATLLATGKLRAIPGDADPLSARFGAIAATLGRATLARSGGVPGTPAAAEQDTLITAADIEEALGLCEPAHRLLGFYTASGIEHALHVYGILHELERLGYDGFEVVLTPVALGDQLRLYAAKKGPVPATGSPAREPMLLLEAVLGRERIASDDFLFVHWLTLRHPLSTFSTSRPRLPSQEVPGLGLAREVGELLRRMSARLGLAGVAFRPMHYHTGYGARHDFRFVDAGRQAQFEALVRESAGRPLAEVSRELEATWSPDVMVFRGAIAGAGQTFTS